MKSTNKPIITLLLAAAVSLAVFSADAGQRMTSSEIEGAFNGITLDGIYNDGTFFSETYKDDGSIRYHDRNGSDSGEWSVKGDTFCTFYESQQGACFFVERDGKNCYTFFEARGDQNGPAPSGAWTSRGWNREGKSTCPTPPGAEI